MKKLKTAILAAATAAALMTVSTAAACASADGTAAYVTSIEQTYSDGTQTTYTIYYSDGTTDDFTVSDGQDGEDLTLTSLYAQYVEETGEDLTLSEFLSLYLSYNYDAETLAVQSNLLSVMKIYTEFVVSETYSTMPGRPTTTTSHIDVYTGSAVIYRMNEDYTYIITNYHVVYLSEADASLNGGSQTARAIYGYLYGSESSPVLSSYDSDNYAVYDYGDYAIELEYIGGSVTSDIAVLRAETDDILAVNPQAKAVTPADGYHVGETAVAIGNPEDYGISVTKGIISVADEYISLNIDGTTRSYRSLRIDTALYEGNSGGGLFNAAGELIGITNAGNSSDENINYAIPLEIVTGTADNIIDNFEAGDDGKCAYKITLGISVDTSNARYVYDSATGYGEICEDVAVTQVEDGSIAQSLGLQAGDVLTAITVNGTEHEILRSFDISDLILTLREGDALQATVVRDGEEITLSSVYTLEASDFESME